MWYIMEISSKLYMTTRHPMPRTDVSRNHQTHSRREGPIAFA